jgi:hypothetical protein
MTTPSDPQADARNMTNRELADAVLWQPVPAFVTTHGRDGYFAVRDEVRRRLAAPNAPERGMVCISRDDYRGLLVAWWESQGFSISGDDYADDVLAGIDAAQKGNAAMSRNENLTDDEQVLFDMREAISGAHLSDGSCVGDYGAEDAIRRLHNMGIVGRRKHERRSPEPDLSSYAAAGSDPA